MNGSTQPHPGGLSRRTLNPEDVRRLRHGDRRVLKSGIFPDKRSPRVLMTDPGKCNGCRLCEMACSLYHEGEIRQELSRIQVIEWQPGLFVPAVCQQCVDAPCRKACPREAISWREEDFRVVIDYRRCVSCRMCVSACPFGAMRFISEWQVVRKCDLCDGDPQCVFFCEPGALTFLDADALPVCRRQAAARWIRRE